ncbi:hypothetical protein ACJW31_04G027000 [Castanea mollissima]
MFDNESLNNVSKRWHNTNKWQLPKFKHKHQQIHLEVEHTHTHTHTKQSIIPHHQSSKFSHTSHHGKPKQEKGTFGFACRTLNRRPRLKKKKKWFGLVWFGFSGV